MSRDHFRRGSEFTEDTGRAVLRHRTNKRIGDGELEGIVDTWNYCDDMRFAHREIRGAKAEKRVAESINLIAVAQCDGAGGCKSVITSCEMHRDGTAAKQGIWFGFPHRTDRRSTARSIHRQ